MCREGPSSQQCHVLQSGTLQPEAAWPWLPLLRPVCLVAGALSLSGSQSSSQHPETLGLAPGVLGTWQDWAQLLHASLTSAGSDPRAGVLSTCRPWHCSWQPGCSGPASGWAAAPRPSRDPRRAAACRLGLLGGVILRA